MTPDPATGDPRRDPMDVAGDLVTTQFPMARAAFLAGATP
jgi:hypothetical protein